MTTPHVSRRDVLLQGSVAIAGMALLRAPGLTYAFSAQPGEEVLNWLDQPAPNPVPDVVGTQLQWEALNTWLTPNDQFFTVGHYDKPVLDPAAWHLQIGGLVQQPLTLTLDDLRAAINQLPGGPAMELEPGAYTPRPLVGAAKAAFLRASEKFATPLQQARAPEKEKGRVPRKNSPKNAPFKWSGRQDLNLRPLGPEPSALPG